MKDKPGKAKVKMFRFDPTIDKEPRYETYEVPSEGWFGIKVIDTIRYIYENFAPGLLSGNHVVSSCVAGVQLWLIGNLFWLVRPLLRKK